jgi:hypothetical protein
VLLLNVLIALIFLWLLCLFDAILVLVFLATYYLDLVNGLNLVKQFFYQNIELHGSREFGSENYVSGVI